MKKARMDGLYLLLLGSAVFLFLGTALESTSPFAMEDFKSVYYGARSLTQHHDPYQESEFLSVYRAEGGTFPSDSAFSRSVRRSILVCINLPTTLFLVAPFAVLGWSPAAALWMILTAGSLILAAFLMWTLGARYAPRISGGLILLVLVNSEMLLIVGNTAGVAVSLCAVAVWCFLEDRFVPAGVLCLAISLAMKPHDAGLVWLYFLLAGGVHRKRALQTLVVTVVLSLLAVFWVSRVAPNWMPELKSNLAATSAHGDLNDPGPASMGGHGIGMVINLQAALSFFRDNPHFYNPAAYLVCGALLIAWLIATLRSRFTPASAWLALAPIAALSLLPVYHRSYDARLLLLTVPACALLWAEGGPIARLALLVTAAGLVLTGDLTWAIILGPLNGLHLALSRQAGQIFIAALVFPVPLILLTMAIFYLWVYMRRAHDPALPKKIEPAEDAPIGSSNGLRIY